MQQLREWIEARGGHCHQLVPAVVAAEGRTLILHSSAAAADAELLCVPPECMLTPQLGEDSESGAAVVAAGGFITTVFKPHTLWLALALLLARDHQLGSASEERALWAGVWNISASCLTYVCAAYIDTLPSMCDCDSFPLLWNPCTLEQRLHTQLGQRVERGQTELDSCWQLLEHTCPALCASCLEGERALQWAVSMALSRSHNIPNCCCCCIHCPSNLITLKEIAAAHERVLFLIVLLQGAL